MKIVLHIASHMGGGVGKVLSNLALSDTEYHHHIILLEKPIDTCFTEKLNSASLTIAPSIDLLKNMIRNTDIVQWDWWWHPLLAKMMHEMKDIPVRSVIWSHTVGCHYPYICPEFVSLPQRFIFSSYYSRQNPHWTLNDIYHMNCTSVVNSSGGFESTENVPLQDHSGFNVGYIGTLGYMKLLPQFVQYCQAISDIPGIRFIMIGRIPEPNQILQDARVAGIADKFVFKGYVDDLPSELAKLDVVGYLLNPHHHGTTENALLEAMSMGVTPVCINQCAEKYLIKNGVTGYLVNSKQEYATVMGKLYQDKKERLLIGRAAKSHITTVLSLDSTISRLHRVYDSLMQYQKVPMDFDRVFGSTPYEWYLNGCPPDDNEFSKYLTDATKGSVAQWAKYFPEDKDLAAMVKK